MKQVAYGTVLYIVAEMCDSNMGSVSRKYIFIYTNASKNVIILMRLQIDI